MRLYAGPSTHFIQDTTHNQIAEKLRTAFFEHYRCVPSPNQVQSWQNSLRATAMVFQEAELNDHGVILEYQLPLSSRRLDCIVTGHDRAASANAVIMELKQWSAVDGASVVGDKVVTWVGGGHRDVLHPSVQAPVVHAAVATGEVRGESDATGHDRVYNRNDEAPNRRDSAGRSSSTSSFPPVTKVR